MERALTPTPYELSAANDQPGRHFAGLVDIELGTNVALQADQTTPYWLRYPPRDLFGVALSGGGIRSATFSLGVLQALAEDGLLQETDYLATVSGGGYTGGFWTAWLNRRAARADAESGQRRVVDFPTADITLGEREHASIRHLREFSRFLSPELGVFSVDTGRMLAAAMNAVVPSLLIAIAVLTVCALVLIGVFLVMPWLPAYSIQRDDGFVRHGVVGAFTMALSSLVMMSVARTGLVKHRQKSNPDSALSDVPRWSLVVVFALVAGVIALLLTGGSAADAHAGALLDLIRCAHRDACQNEALIATHGAPAWHLTWSAFLFTLYPAGAALIVVALIAVIRAWVHTRGGENSLALELDTIASWFLLGTGFCIAFDAAFALAISVGPLLDIGLGALGGAAGLLGLVARVTWMIAMRGRTSKASSAKWVRVLLASAWYIVLAVAVVAVLAIVTSITLNHPGWLLPIAVVALVVMLAGLFGIDANYLGMHRFYRSRIARAYLGAAERVRGSRPQSAEQPGDDMPLRDLLPGTPVHLVCCAANDLSPSVPMVNLSRGAGSAVLSRAGFSVGSKWYAWKEHASPRAKDYDGPRSDLEQTPTLASALTASGAAFNTHMGKFSNEFGRASTFIMSALGLRLGLWLPHPRRWRDGITQSRGGALSRDALGLSSTDADSVFLSDGGHFENTALYELIRRHCRWILVSDAGADPEVQFNDLGNAIRRVRVDFSVEIRIDLDPIRPNAQRQSAQPVVVGDIYYPDGDTGVIVIVKPTLMGNEPADVANYAATHEEFPHQPTVDQFFDEDQWESYRRLGLHCTRSALWPLVSQTPLTDGARPAASAAAGSRVRERFSDLRRHWFTLHAGCADFTERAAEAMIALNARLAREDVSGLAAQIRREVAVGLDADNDPRAYGGVSRKQQLACVSLLREALIRFEQLYVEGDLVTTWSAPQYLGLMNGMARWVRTPFMRAWWPVLQSQSSQAFREFMTARFGAGMASQSVQLKRIANGAKHDPGVVSVHDLPPGDFAENRERVVLIVSEQEEHLSGPRLESARLTFARLQEFSTIAWRAGELDVPASLWGTGFGTAMLAQLRADAELSALGQCVAVPYGAKAPYEARKRHADTMQLYAAAGFAPVVPTQRAMLLESVLQALDCPPDEWVLMRREPVKR